PAVDTLERLRPVERIDEGTDHACARTFGATKREGGVGRRAGGWHATIVWWLASDAGPGKRPVLRVYKQAPCRTSPLPRYPLASKRAWGDADRFGSPARALPQCWGIARARSGRAGDRPRGGRQRRCLVERGQI